MHTVSRLSIATGADHQLHLALGCSHLLAQECLCGATAFHEEQGSTPPEASTACTRCATVARSAMRGFVPRGSDEARAAFGFKVSTADPLAVAGALMSDLPPIGAEELGAVGAAVISTDERGGRHADQWCALYEDRTAVTANLEVTADGVLASEGQRLHCHRGLPTHITESLVAFSMVTDERQFLTYLSGHDGWGLYEARRDSEGNPNAALVIERLMAKEDVVTDVNPVISRAHRQNVRAWGELMIACDGWEASRWARRASDEMAAFNVIARGGIPRELQSVERMRFVIEGFGVVAITPASTRVGVHGEVEPLGEISHMLVHGMQTDADGEAVAMPDWCAEDIADFLETQDFAVKHYATEINGGYLGKLVAVEDVPSRWTPWPHRLTDGGAYECWVPESILLAEHLSDLSGPTMTEGLAKAILRAE